MIPFNSRLPSLDELVEEVAVSVNINGINHAVMMATPDDLDDFAIGFLFGEGTGRDREHFVKN
jgi:FdhD protein